jgi:hypothetical protein
MGISPYHFYAAPTYICAFDRKEDAFAFKCACDKPVPILFPVKGRLLNKIFAPFSLEILMPRYFCYMMQKLFISDIGTCRYVLQRQWEWQAS